MKRISLTMLAFALGTFVLAANASYQPPGGKERDGDKKGGMRGAGVGKIIPPFLAEQLKLSDDQKAAIAEIEKDVKTKLDKILTDDQKKMLENPARPDRGPEGGGKGGKGGDRGGKGGPGGDKGGKGGPGGDKGGKGGEKPPQA